VLVRPDDGGVDHRYSLSGSSAKVLKRLSQTRAPAQREKRLWVFFQSPSAPANHAMERLNGISISPPRQTADCPVRYCGNRAGAARQKRLNPRKLVVAQSIALHRKAP